MKCQGECNKRGECAGDVRRVNVTGNGWILPWVFNYCETAIANDKGNGFTVEEAEEEPEEVQQLLTAR